MYKKDYNLNLSIWISETSRYLKSIFDDSVIVYDETIGLTNIASINATNNVLRNVTINVSVDSDNKKVRYKMDCYIYHTFLLVTITIFWFCYCIG